ncbi:MAG: PAS domain S-box protein [Polyangiales bacterium]
MTASLTSDVTSIGTVNGPDAALVSSILIVDDHPANLLALEGILEPLDQHIIRAASGEEALRKVLGQDFAVILMDVQMPGLDGFQTAALIKARERSRHTPIIFLTAINKDSSYIFKGYAQGAVDYLVKPFDPDILRSKVTVFVELWKRGELLAQKDAQLREKELDEAARASEYRYQNLTNAMPLLLWACDADGKVYLRNRAYWDYTGLARDQHDDDAALSVVHDEDRPHLERERGRSLADGNAFRLEYRMREASTGEYRWFLVRIVPERDSRGDITGWIGTATDIHELKNAQHALAEFKTTLDATRDAVLIVDPETLKLQYANEGAARQLGTDRESLLQTTLLDAEPELDEGRLHAMLEPLIKGEVDTHTYQTRHRRRDGSLVPVEVLLQHIALDGGRARLVAVVRDITERVRVEAELRRANEAKDDFLAAASHELRTPLAAAKAQAQLALRKLRDEVDSGPKRSLTVISTQIDRMAKLVENLLDISRIEAGRLSLEIESFDLAASVRDLAERMQALTTTHRIEVTAPESLHIGADRDRVEQVLNNLVSNAIRYSPKGGQIAIALAAAGEHVELTVKDEGVGIPAEALSLIFERFGRAHGSKYGGLGLGLTISQGIVEQHGGTITVTSEGEAGRGTRFVVRLPRHAVVAAPPPNG